MFSRHKSTKETVKTIVQEMPDVSGGPVCSCAFSLMHIAHETAGAARARSSPRPPLAGSRAPSVFWGRTICKNSGGCAPRGRDGIFNRHRPARPGDLTFQSIDDKHERSGILDHPLSRVMTAEVLGCLKIESVRATSLDESR
jgi:hypothetical protein